MAAVRNRPAAHSVPRDENADALGKLGGKAGLRGKGLQQQLQQQQQQQPNSGDKPRRMLADITNVKNVQPYSVSKGDNTKPAAVKAALGGSENAVARDGGKGLPRAPLRNITNSGSQLRGPSDAGAKLGKQKLSQLPVQAGAGNAVSRAHIAGEDVSAKVQRWAEEGIEKVHFTAADMEALRRKIEDEEIEKRVAKVLAYRTDLPRLWHLPAEPKFTNSAAPLQPDPIDDRLLFGPEDDEPMELEAPDCEDALTSNSKADELLASNFLNWNSINLSVKEF